MKTFIFEVQAEVKGIDNVKIPKEYIGAFVNVYVPADSLEESIEIARDTLKDDNYEVQSFEWAVKIEIEDWTVTDENAPTKQELESMLLTNAISYGTFHRYQSEYEH